MSYLFYFFSLYYNYFMIPIKNLPQQNIIYKVLIFSYQTLSRLGNRQKPKSKSSRQNRENGRIVRQSSRSLLGCKANISQQVVFDASCSHSPPLSGLGCWHRQWPSCYWCEYLIFLSLVFIFHKLSFYPTPLLRSCTGSSVADTIG